MTRRKSLSVNVICFNEHDRIGSCLASVAGWADQIVVIDSGSTDGTLEIATQYATDLYSADWPGYGIQRQRALDRSSGDFILWVDADEVVSDELKAEIDQVLAGEPDCTLYLVQWVLMFLGKPMRNGRYGSPQTRLFRREGAQFPTAQVHETLKPAPGKRRTLKGGILHYSYRDLRHCLRKHNDYAWLLAQEKFARGRRPSLAFAVGRALWEFVHQYFLRRLFLDGARGFLLACVLSQYAFNKFALTWSIGASGATVDDARFDPSHRVRRAEPEAVRVHDDSKVVRVK